MARLANRLSHDKIRRISAPGMYADGNGLYLQIAKSASDSTSGQLPASWILRFKLNGRTRYMGLGGLTDTKLAEARQAAAEARKLIRDGIDPIEHRHAERERQRLEAAQSVTFQAVADDFISQHKATWQNEKHRQQWSNTLETYVFPQFGDLPVGDVDTDKVLAALQPIWLTKPETASRVRQRIEAVLAAATARGLRTGANPAAWRGHLERLLPRRSKVAAVRNHPALPYRDLPAFWQALSGREAMSAKALGFLVLTASRSGEVRGATWQEIDMEEKLWVIPADRMKSRRQHRVPLSDAALETLRAVQPKNVKPADVVFPGFGGRPMSDATMRKYLQSDMKLSDVVPHGFRSSFRSWAAECTNFPRELAEAALAHVLRDKTEAAYQRGDLLDRRRMLMDAWASYCASGDQHGKVVSLNRSTS